MIRTQVPLSNLHNLVLLSFLNVKEFYVVLHCAFHAQWLCSAEKFNVECSMA